MKLSDADLSPIDFILFIIPSGCIALPQLSRSCVLFCFCFPSHVQGGQQLYWHVFGPVISGDSIQGPKNTMLHSGSVTCVAERGPCGAGKHGDPET